ncbi:gluconate 2-dehydrogenase subunit 3 family protein [Hymenobacter terrenus]|uniref:gluconate 2-dehydrogenase subunit 3 family protein n=1 Tax=Hymenobacter terrenus TaxID=1629124 RepID=UPI0006194B14|nr:gluconate 2-dehydrogenase subunit 3 family protein [Hymenobacter terrenus]
MNRRDALARVALLMSGTIIGADLFLSSCSSPASKEQKAALLDPGKKAPSTPFLNASQIGFLDEVGETILPTTSTPGAKAAQVGSFMAVMVRDCYTPANQKIFLDGLTQLEQRSQKRYNQGFMALNAAQRTALLTALDAEQNALTAHQRPDAPSHYFRMMKQLTLLGYFTSEVGATKALRYQLVPGRYNGNIPYKKGDKTWATT